MRCAMCSTQKATAVTRPPILTQGDGCQTQARNTHSIPQCPAAERTHPLTLQSNAPTLALHPCNCRFLAYAQHHRAHIQSQTSPAQPNVSPSSFGYCLLYRLMHTVSCCL